MKQPTLKEEIKEILLKQEIELLDNLEEKKDRITMKDICDKTTYQILTLIQKRVEEWNCQCDKPKPNGVYEVGESEGNYQRCKTCDRRIWS